MLKEFISKYVSITKYPYTSRDISTYLFKKHWIRVNPRLIRSVLKEQMNMSYKLGKSRPVYHNETNTFLMKCIFSIKLSKTMNNFDALINIDETMFSRLTKTSRSWSQKGREMNLMNICFSNSTSLITAITTFGDVFTANINGSVTSEVFIQYLKELECFLIRKIGVLLSNWLLIMDNASIHRSSKMKEFIEEKKLSVAYIPAYSPELAPVERYFSMLKRLVTKQSSGLQVNWKSEKSRCLLKQSMHQITPKKIQNFWLTLTYEMKESIAKIEDLIY